MVDAPGTHHDAIRHHEVVLPLIDLAARLDRDGSSDDAALVELRRFPGCTGSALLDAASILDRSDSPRVIRTAELLRRAAHPL
jgi:hypothetical protein